MADEEAPSALDRIDNAIARIKAAASHKDEANAAIGHRHDALRLRIADAVTALDDILARGKDDE